MCDVQSFEAMLRVNGTPEEVNHRIDHFGGRSLGEITNVNTGGRLSFAIEDPVCEIDKLNKAFAYLVSIEFDCALINVLGALRMISA